MWIKRVLSSESLVVRKSQYYLLKTHDYLRYGITGTTGLTPFVVVVGSNNFLPVPVCLLTRSEIWMNAVT